MECVPYSLWEVNVSDFARGMPAQALNHDNVVLMRVVLANKAVKFITGRYLNRFDDRSLCFLRRTSDALVVALFICRKDEFMENVLLDYVQSK